PFYGEPPDVTLWQLLLVAESDLKKFARDLFLEPGDSIYLREVTRLRDAVSAYTQFQDLMGIAEHAADPPVHRHYCYSQRLVYLRESVVSFLDKNVLAGFTLLRPFLELSILHLYWYARCERAGYAPYYQWLYTGKGKPPFRNSAEYALANLPCSPDVPPERLERLRNMVIRLFSAASAYNHSPALDESMVTLSRGIERISRDTFFFYLISATLFVTQMTYCYILAYPMILFPVS